MCIRDSPYTVSINAAAHNTVQPPPYSNPHGARISQTPPARRLYPQIYPDSPTNPILNLTISGPPIHTDILDSISRQQRNSSYTPHNTPQQLFTDSDQTREPQSDNQIAPLSTFH